MVYRRLQRAHHQKKLVLYVFYFGTYNELLEFELVLKLYTSLYFTQYLSSLQDRYERKISHLSTKICVTLTCSCSWQVCCLSGSIIFQFCQYVLEENKCVIVLVLIKEYQYYLKGRRLFFKEICQQALAGHFQRTNMNEQQACEILTQTTEFILQYNSVTITLQNTMSEKFLYDKRWQKHLPKQFFGIFIIICSLPILNE
eukprot:TRINITY_DN18126_c0_g1_i1.p3 TRINITY_DN18126_c0_g1~~TRINITY_DN18126_c0_g1_i1.p3  ORF type:complete len:200 (-),score=-12.79 TRINITY_DN18126_c0_g1_i1:754-1353(-)